MAELIDDLLRQLRGGPERDGSCHTVVPRRLTVDVKPYIPAPLTQYREEFEFVLREVVEANDDRVDGFIFIGERACQAEVDMAARVDFG